MRYSLNETNAYGHQSPRILHSPVNLGLSQESAGKEVAELALMAGLDLDPWQRLFLDHALATRSDTSWAAREVGLVVSRQNGKGSILEAMELGSLFLLDEEVCIHSAHLFDTSLEAFNRIMILIEQTPDLEQMVKRVIRSHGEEGIEVWREGRKRRLRFKTRTKGGGRGLTGDRVIIDEAMYFAAQTAAALLPVVSARPNPQIVYTGSAGDRDSEHFGRVRQRGVEGTDPRLMFMEWSIDACDDLCLKDCTEHDRMGIEPGLKGDDLIRAYEEMAKSYAKANPGLGIRISVEACESERRSMDGDTFACERLGVGDWPIEGEAWRVIGEAEWMNCYDELSQITTAPTFAIDTTPDKRYSCIVVAGGNDDGMSHVEITGDGVKADHRPGTKWVVPRAIELHKKHRKAVFVVDKGTQAGAYIDELEKAGCTVISPTAREFAQACGEFHAAVVPRGGNEPILRHINQPTLSAAVAGGDKRDLADVWAWDKRNSMADISPLVAATGALWGHMKRVNKPKPRPMAAWG